MVAIVQCQKPVFQVPKIWYPKQFAVEEPID